MVTRQGSFIFVHAAGQSQATTWLVARLLASQSSSNLTGTVKNRFVMVATNPLLHGCLMGLSLEETICFMVL
jgi:hypothetical protein